MSYPSSSLSQIHHLDEHKKFRGPSSPIVDATIPIALLVYQFDFQAIQSNR
ncbi:hypothetical protein BH10CYA1_BH10CYA1_53900 [soil metagenome]